MNLTRSQLCSCKSPNRGMSENRFRETRARERGSHKGGSFPFMYRVALALLHETFLSRWRRFGHSPFCIEHIGHFPNSFQTRTRISSAPEVLKERGEEGCATTSHHEILTDAIVMLTIRRLCKLSNELNAAFSLSLFLLPSSLINNIQPLNSSAFVMLHFYVQLARTYFIESAD